MGVVVEGDEIEIRAIENRADDHRDVESVLRDRVEAPGLASEAA